MQRIKEGKCRWAEGASCSASADERSVGFEHIAAATLHERDSLQVLVNATAIVNAVRLQPLGYRPGVTGGRVGLLEGVRTPDMDKYDEVEK